MEAPEHGNPRKYSGTAKRSEKSCHLKVGRNGGGEWQVEPSSPHMVCFLRWSVDSEVGRGGGRAGRENQHTGTFSPLLKKNQLYFRPNILPFFITGYGRRIFNWIPELSGQPDIRIQISYIFYHLTAIIKKTLLFLKDKRPMAV